MGTFVLHRSIRGFVIAAACLLPGAVAPGTAWATDLSVVVTGLESDGGDVHIALYDTPETFPKSRAMREEVRPRPSGRAATWRFTGLPPGRYAIATYHDANGNDEFDQGLFGIPLEDFGFSNGATAFLGPPSFADAAFDLPPEGATVTIDLGNAPDEPN